MVDNVALHSMPHFNSVSRQRIVVVACVLLLHGLALWALQTGLLQRVVAAAQEVVMVSVMPEVPKPSQPVVAKAAVPAKPTTQPQPVPVPVTPKPAAAVPAPVTPAPLAVADAPNAPPAPHAPIGVAVAQPVAAPAPAAPPAAPKVELPSSTADYLHNPKPKYPRLSQSRNEQGTVILSVLVGLDGKVREVTVKSSSGFDLLDRTAREAVQGWTFVPGKRNGAPVEMAVDVPIPFRLTD